MATSPKPVPVGRAGQFVKAGEHYYFRDGSMHAFSDFGDKLIKRGHHPEVVRSLVGIARDRGWDHTGVFLDHPKKLGSGLIFDISKKRNVRISDPPP